MTVASLTAPTPWADLQQRGRAALRLLVIYLLPWFVFVPMVRLYGSPLSSDDLLPLFIATAGLGVRLLGARPRFEAVTACLLGVAVVSLFASLTLPGTDAEMVRSVARGFGRTLGIDYDLVIPDDTRTLADGAVKPWQTESYLECQGDLMRFASRL